jgi:hypothetical protein
MPKTEFNLRPSRQQFFLLVMMVLVSEIILFTAALPISILFKILASFGVGMYGYYLWRRQNLVRTICVKELGKNIWQLETKKGSKIGQLQGDSTVTNMICILRFQVEGKFLPVTSVIFKDALLPNEYRQLLMTISMMR